MDFTRGVGARIQIWPTIVYGFLLVLKSVTTAVGGIYACLLFSCRKLENYLRTITQTAVERLPPSPSLVLHEYCVLILERTCIIRELCSRHFSKACDSVVTQRQFDIRLLYFVVALSEEIKKFPFHAFHNLPASERGYFKDLMNVRRHCLCWLNSSVHSLQSFILLHICVDHIHCFTPITVEDIANIKIFINNIFTVKSSKSISCKTNEVSSVKLVNENLYLDDGNLRQPIAVKVESKVCNEASAIGVSHGNLQMAIEMNEQADFKNDSRNLNYEGNYGKGLPSTSHYYDFNVTKIPEHLPEFFFDSDEKVSETIRHGESYLSKEIVETSQGAFNVPKISAVVPENLFDCDEKEESEKVNEERDLLKETFETSNENFNATKLPEDVSENFLDSDKKVEPEKVIENRDLSNGILEISHGDFSVTNKSENSSEIKADENTNDYEQVNTPQNFVWDPETKPGHESKVTTEKIGDKTCNLNEIAPGNSKETESSMNLKKFKGKLPEIGRFLSLRGVSYEEFTRNRSLKNYSAVTLEIMASTLKVQIPTHVTLDKIVIDIEDKTAISLLKESDKPCKEVSDLKLLFYFALKGEIAVLATSTKWITYSSKYFVKVKQKYKDSITGFMVCLCMKEFVLDFCDFHFKNIKERYEVNFYCLRGSQKYYAIGLEKIKANSVEKDDNDIIYPVEFANTRNKFVPYYDWELPVEDGIEEELCSPVDDSIQEPKIASTVYEYTVGFGTLPDRLKNMLKIKYPNMSDYSDVTVQFPVMTPQEIVADKGKQFVFLNWWNNFLSKTEANSKQSITDAFVRFLKRESEAERIKQIEEKPKQDNCTLDMQLYQQSDIKEALIWKDVKITHISDVPSNVDANEILSTVPLQNEKLEDWYYGIDINTILSNCHIAKCRKDESQESKIAETTAIVTCNRQKQAKICDDTNCDQSQQNTSANGQKKDCNKKKTKSSRKKSNRNKHKKTTNEVGKEKIIEETKDCREDPALIHNNTDNDQQKKSSRIKHRKATNEVNKGQIIEEAKDNKENPDFIRNTIDSDQQTKSSSIKHKKATDEVSQEHIIGKAKDNKIPDHIRNKNTNDLQNQKASKEMCKIKQTQGSPDEVVNRSAPKRVTTKKTKIETPKQLIIDEPMNNLPKPSTIDEKIDIKEADIGKTNNAQKPGINYKEANIPTQKRASAVNEDKVPKIQKCENSPIHASEDSRISLRPFYLTQKTFKKEVQNSSSGIVNNGNLRDSAHPAKSKDAGNTSVVFKNRNTNKLCSETGIDLDATRKISHLNRDVEHKPVANSRSNPSTPSCPAIKVHSEVIPQKNTDILQKKLYTSENNQTIHEPSRIEIQDVKTKDEPMTFMLYSDVVKQKRSAPDHSVLNKTTNNQLVTLGISKLPQSSSNIHPTLPSSTASTCCNDSEISTCSIARTTDTITSACSSATESSTHPGGTARSTSLIGEISLCSDITLSTCVIDTTASTLSSTTVASIYRSDTVALTSIIDTSSCSSVTIEPTCLVATTSSVVLTTPMCLIVTTASTFCSITVPSMHSSYTAASTNFIEPTSSICPISIDSSAFFPIATAASTYLNGTTASTFYSPKVLSTCPVITITSMSFTTDTISSCHVSTVSPGLIVTPMSLIVATTSTCLIDTNATLFSSATIPSTYHGDTLATMNLIDTTLTISPITATSSTYPVATFASTCTIVTTLNSAIASSTNFHTSSMLSSVTDMGSSTYPGDTAMSTYSVATSALTCPSANSISTFSNTSCSKIFNPIVASTYLSPTVSSTCHSSSTKLGLTKFDGNSSSEHKHLPSKARRSPDQRQSLTVAQRLSAAFLKSKSEAVQSETQTKDLRPFRNSITEETPSNSEENVAPKHLCADSPNEQISNELLIRPSVAMTVAPSTQISRELVPKKSQTNDSPNVQVTNEMARKQTTDCDENRTGNLLPKVSKNPLMTDDESESSNSSDNPNPVSEYKFFGVRQKLRSDIAEKLTEIMRKKVKSKSETKSEK